MERSCPACDSSEHTRKGIKDNFPMLSCKRCKTLYTSYLPDGESALNYDDYYPPKNLTFPDFIHQRLDELMVNFASYRRTNRFLDVGCGAGSLLQAAVRANWLAEGLEISPPAVKHLKQAGFNVRCEYLEQANYPDGHFDVVAASEVLEHVPNVQPFLAEVARVLRPGGLFYATTPNGAGGSALALGLKWSVVSPPEHLQLFSVKGMKMLLVKVALRPLRVVSEGINPFEMLYVLRHSTKNGDAVNQVHNRVASAYALNESLTRSSYRRIFKNAANSLLRASKLGDGLKIYAEK